MQQKIINKILYIGSGLHLDPIQHFPHTHEFVFVDTQPRNDIDDIKTLYNYDMYNIKFMNKLNDAFVANGFECISNITLNSHYYRRIMKISMALVYTFSRNPRYINPTLLVYTNKKTNQVVKYYISTNFRVNMCEQLHNDIITSDALIVNGFSPDMDLLNYFSNSSPKILIGYSDTRYGYSSTRDMIFINTILYKLYKKHNEALNKFAKYYFINKTNGKIEFIKDTYTKFLEAVEIYKKNETFINSV